MNLLLTLAFPFVLHAQEHATGIFYDIKSNLTKKLYTCEVQINPAGELTQFQAEYKDLDGKTAVLEKGLVKGDELKSFDLERPQTNEKGHVEVRDGRIYFEYEKDGAKKTADEKLKGFVLATVNFSAFVKSHWAELAKGDGIDVRFAVWDRRETVGFTLQKVKETDRLMQLRMKPTSFVIAAIVDPVFLTFSKADQRLTTMKGRVAPKQLVNGSWKDLDAETVYTSEAGPAAKASATVGASPTASVAPNVPK